MVKSDITAKIAVFAGPSAFNQWFPSSQLVHLFPPASAGDIPRVTRDGDISIVILADTLFADASPTHRELIDTLKGGVRLIGCSSGGALRAIELRKHGMAGHGCVYEAFKEGLLNDDGELASVLDAEYAAITPPLIEVRYYLHYLAQCGLPHEAGIEIMTELKSIYYMRRTIDDIQVVIARHSCSWQQRKDLRPFIDPMFRLKKLDLLAATLFALGRKPEWTPPTINSLFLDDLRQAYDKS